VNSENDFVYGIKNIHRFYPLTYLNLKSNDDSAFVCCSSFIFFCRLQVAFLLSYQGELNRTV